MAIPKKIHYCWFGNNPMSDVIQDCIKTWKKWLPDFELILWNEENSDLNHPFAKYAYEHKKWAYVSDYVRLEVLYKQGGIYLDTDMFLTKSLLPLLEHRAFFGAEDAQLISCGILGAEAGHPVIAETLKYYSAHPLTDRYFRFAIPRVLTQAVQKVYPSLALDFVKTQRLEALTIYAPEFFYPLPYVKDRPFDKNFIRLATPQTYAIHLWEGSWVSYSEFQHFRRREYGSGLKMIFNNFGKQTFTFKYIRKIASAIKSSIFVSHD